MARSLTATRLSLSTPRKSCKHDHLPLRPPPIVTSETRGSCFPKTETGTPDKFAKFGHHARGPTITYHLLNQYLSICEPCWDHSLPRSGLRHHLPLRRIPGGRATHHHHLRSGPD